METLEPRKLPRTKRVRATNANKRETDLPRTPESELMSVEEYFGILHRMVDEHFDSIPG
ncbi:MAG: hypothetical protein IJ760_01590 [Bacteroidales bacterium]|nr:hypothetical protein [Bacteroidales bacterium]